jgi:hypothetical protein
MANHPLPSPAKNVRPINVGGKKNGRRGNKRDYGKMKND